MKINNNTNRSKKKWLIIPVIVLLLAGSAFAAYRFLKPNTDTASTSETRPVNTVDYSPATNTEAQETADSKKKSIEQQDQPQEPGDVSVLISRAGQSSPGLPVAVRTIVTGTTSGNCDFVFTMGDVSFSKSFEIKHDATTYTCNGDVEATNFSDSGDWTLVIRVGSVSTQSEGTIHVQK